MRSRLLVVLIVALAGACASVKESPPPAKPERERGTIEDVDGYPEEERKVGTPVDVDRDLATAFPKSDSVLEGAIAALEYFEWKERLYEKHGIKLAFSYQGVAQAASDVRSQRLLTGAPTDDFWAGGWLLLEGKWEAYNRGRDWQGALTVAYDWRHTYGTDPTAFSQFDTGSLWPTDFTIIEWDPWFSSFYWEQWADKDRFVARVGGQAAPQIFDFFRFKDARSSFTNTEFTFPAASMPIPGPGLGVSFEWWPIEKSTLYVVGTLNDMNFTVGENFNWGSFFDESQYFYGLEIGHNWVRAPGDFDHVHLNLFYSDGVAQSLPGFPNQPGGGFKLRGSKQWGRIVAFGSYTYNTAEGGAFGNTWMRHAITLGAAYVKPLDIRGELAMGANWGHPIQTFTGPVLPELNGMRDQYGLETYWKILLTPDLWITPAVSFIWNPSLNPGTDFLVLFTFKFRFFV
jgi:hypothetical protein